MSKSIINRIQNSEYSRQNLRQDNTGFYFIVLIIMDFSLIGAIFKGYLPPLPGCRISAFVPGPAGSPQSAGSNFKTTPEPEMIQGKLNTTAQTVSSVNLSCGPSFLRDREKYSGIEKTETDIPDTDKLLNSIVEKLWQLESGKQLNPPDGDDGDAVGPLQLHKEVLLDVNKYYKKNFSPQDRLDLNKSKEIAKLYILMWLEIQNSEFRTQNPEEAAVRIFNGGPRGWASTSTDAYWNKFKTQSVK